MDRPRGRDALHSATAVALALALCPLAALVTTRDADVPVARARSLVDFERALGLYVEYDLYAWLQRHEGLFAAAGAFYLWAHISALIGVLVTTWCLRPARFARLRDGFLCTQLLVVAGYVALPTAPPRLVPGLGYGDTLSQLWGGDGASLAHSVQSPYAAMPSGHVAFAVIVAAGLWGLSSRATVRACTLGYPAAVTLVVLSTANHLWIDAAAGAVVALAGLGAAHVLRRAPSAWTPAFPLVAWRARGPAPYRLTEPDRHAGGRGVAPPAREAFGRGRVTAMSPGAPLRHPD